jgi:pimeloyl-ACP methyl ester carboxylesterase
MEQHMALRIAPVALALGTLLVISSCTVGEPPEVDEGLSVAPGFRDLSPYLAQDVSWAQCDADWRVEVDFESPVLEDSVVDCARVLVPAVYTDSDITEDFSIALMRVSPLSGPTPERAIFINPGGPGGSGVDQVQSSDFPEELRAEFAFIGFDPRGVGLSTFASGEEIRCSDELDYISYFGEGTPANEAELDALVALNDEYYIDCSTNNPLWWTLSTDNVVRDLDLLRQLVTPDQPLNFIGSSYGTTIAGSYVSSFPESVGKIVFDSPTTVDTDPIESALINYAADELKLRGYVEGYSAHAGIAFDEAWERVLAVRAVADADGLVGYAGYELSSVVPDSMVSSESLFTRGIQMLNYYPESDAQDIFNTGMDDAYEYGWNGTFEWLGFTLDGYDADSLDGASLAEKNIVRSNEFEIRVIVNTMDFSLPPLTDDEQREWITRVQEVAPLIWELYSDASGYQYIGPPKGLDWRTLAIADDRIPDPPSVPFVPSNPSGKQLLIVGSLFESVTPFSFAEDTATLLGSPLITVESDVHGPTAGYNIDCLNEILIRYFLSEDTIEAATCTA